MPPLESAPPTIGCWKRGKSLSAFVDVDRQTGSRRNRRGGLDDHACTLYFSAGRV